MVKNLNLLKCILPIKMTKLDIDTIRNDYFKLKCIPRVFLINSARYRRMRSVKTIVYILRFTNLLL